MATPVITVNSSSTDEIMTLIRGLYAMAGWSFVDNSKEITDLYNVLKADKEGMASDKPIAIMVMLNIHKNIQPFLTQKEGYRVAKIALDTYVAKITSGITHDEAEKAARDAVAADKVGAEALSARKINNYFSTIKPRGGRRKTKNRKNKNRKSRRSRN